MKNDGFSNHLTHRFFERYGKIISKEDIARMNEISKSAPQLKCTTIKYFEYLEKTVYVYIKSGTIASFITKQQAFRTQELEKTRKEKVVDKAAGRFNIGEIVNL